MNASCRLVASMVPRRLGRVKKIFGYTGPESQRHTRRAYPQEEVPMRPLLLLALLPAAPSLQIVKPVLSQMEGGVPDPPGFEHTPGEIVWFSCRIAGYTKSEDEKVHLRFSVQAFDPQGIPLDEIYTNEITAEVSPQDKEWQPK